jgi:hypothetical protein
MPGGALAARCRPRRTRPLSTPTVRLVTRDEPYQWPSDGAESTIGVCRSGQTPSSRGGRWPNHECPQGHLCVAGGEALGPAGCLDRRLSASNGVFLVKSVHSTTRRRPNPAKRWRPPRLASACDPGGAPAARCRPWRTRPLSTPTSRLVTRDEPYQWPSDGAESTSGVCRSDQTPSSRGGRWPNHEGPQRHLCPAGRTQPLLCSEHPPEQGGPRRPPRVGVRLVGANERHGHRVWLVEGVLGWGREDA